MTQRFCRPWLGLRDGQSGGCHLSAFLAAQEVFLDLLRPHAVRAKADYVKFFESLGNCVNSLQTCFFTLLAYLLEPPLVKYTPNLFLGLLMQELPQVAILLMDYTLYKDFWSAVTGIKCRVGNTLKRAIVSQCWSAT